MLKIDDVKTLISSCAEEKRIAERARAFNSVTEISHLLRSHIKKYYRQNMTKMEKELFRKMPLRRGFYVDDEVCEALNKAGYKLHKEMLVIEIPCAE